MNRREDIRILLGEAPEQEPQFAALEDDFARIDSASSQSGAITVQESEALETLQGHIEDAITLRMLLDNLCDGGADWGDPDWVPPEQGGVEQLVATGAGAKAIEDGSLELSDQFVAFVGQRFIVEITGVHGIEGGPKRQDEALPAGLDHDNGTYFVLTVWRSPDHRFHGWEFPHGGPDPDTRVVERLAFKGWGAAFNYFEAVMEAFCFDDAPWRPNHQQRVTDNVHEAPTR